MNITFHQIGVYTVHTSKVTGDSEHRPLLAAVYNWTTHPAFPESYRITLVGAHVSFQTTNRCAPAVTIRAAIVFRILVAWLMSLQPLKVFGLKRTLIAFEACLLVLHELVYFQVPILCPNVLALVALVLIHRSEINHL